MFLQNRLREQKKPKAILMISLWSVFSPNTKHTNSTIAFRVVNIPLSNHRPVDTVGKRFFLFYQ
jgi:hypothetical protein